MSIPFDRSRGVSATDVSTKSDSTWADPRADVRLNMSKGDGDWAVSFLRQLGFDGVGSLLVARTV